MKKESFISKNVNKQWKLTLRARKMIIQQMIDSTQHAWAVPNCSNTGTASENGITEK